MSKRSKVSRNYAPVLAGLLLLLFFITFQLSAKNNHDPHIFHSLTNNSDTTVPAPVKKNIKDSTVSPADTLGKPPAIINAPDSFFIKDSLRNADTSVKQRIDSMIISKDSLDAPIDYSADDSGVLIIPTRQFFFIW